MPTEEKKSNPMLAVLSALIANLIIAIMKTIVGFISGSQSIINEAIHSFVDVTDQALLFIGDKSAARASSEKHNFGYGRDKYFFAFIVSVLLFSIGGLYGIMESVEKLHHLGSHVNPKDMILPIVLLAFSGVVEFISLQVDFKLAKSHRKPGESLWQFIHNTTIAELIVCILEDLAAVIGCLIGLTGVTLTLITGNAIFDALGGLGIGILLLGIAIILAVEFHSLILGESLSSGDLAKINEILASKPEVAHVLNIKTSYLGPETLLIALKLDIETESCSNADIINDLEAQIRAYFSDETVYIFIEEDDYDPEYI
ncbi:MAG: cation diffusion facilitator family transporter [Lactobacillales bacterium]|jgi:cation diffusion facilitator family transporter|nr:cation diffusion facilitator family transporter [Lactobacillales bacterium]